MDNFVMYPDRRVMIKDIKTSICTINRILNNVKHNENLDDVKSYISCITNMLIPVVNNINFLYKNLDAGTAKMEYNIRNELYHGTKDEEEEKCRARAFNDLIKRVIRLRSETRN